MANEIVRSSSDFADTRVIGRLTADPELRHTSGGKAVTSFTVAVNRTWGSGNSRGSKTEFLRCVAWGKRAETLAQYGAKGRQMHFELTPQERGYESRRYADVRPLRELVESVSGQNTVSVSKLEAAMAECLPAQQSQMEFVVNRFRFLGPNPNRNTGSDAGEEADDEQVETPF